MDRRTRNTCAGLLILLGLLLLAVPVKADFEIAYCSTQNTGSGNAMLWDWQSNGWCTDHCKGSAFAVVLENSCWCSDYVPGADQQSISNCNDPCPGYPTEKCGNKDKKFYQYIKQSGVEPKGTKGASLPAFSSKTATSTPTTLQTSVAPIIPQTSIRIVTQSGLIVTETVVSTPTTTPVELNQEQSVNKGAIIGGAVGGFVGLAAIAGALVFILFRRRRQPDEKDDDQNGVHRNVSTMSRSGLLRTEQQPRSYPPPIVTNIPTNIRQSRNLDQDSISPISGSDRRNSRHMTDQRLNPNALFVFENSSSGSLGTIDDSRDYNRTLNVRNPDP